MSKIKDALKTKKGVLAWNTLMLYILTFSNQLLSLVVVPYESRVLGIVSYGSLGVATAIMVYFQLVLDFGFLLSATRDVSAHREDKNYLNRLLSSVSLCKLGLSLIAVIALFVLCTAIPSWNDRLAFYMVFLAGTVFNAMIPDYLYRGLEHMTAITVRTVIIKTIFAVGVFVFVHGPEDLMIIPAITAVGNLIAMIACFIDLKKRFGISFCAVSFGEVLQCLKSSSVFFFSRIATTAYSVLNTVILDTITASGAATGYYTAADKLINSGKNILSPVSDSLYPYMTRNKDYKLVKRVMLILEPCIIIFCIGAFIWAEPLCKLVFGAEYGPAGQVLRAMLPVGIVIFPSYVCGFPMLSAMGIPKYANYSTIFGSVCHIINLGILYFTGHMNMITLAATISVAETIILAFRLAVIYKYRYKLKGDEADVS